MFKRKLAALDYHTPDKFSHTDEQEFRNLMLWLEDQKIRHYKIEDRAGLRSICAGDWQDHLRKYLGDLNCPIPVEERTAMIDWLLGYAVRLEYGDDVDKYKAVVADQSSGQNAAATNPMESLDFESADFKAGVASLATLLQIPPHKDHLERLKAICIIVREKLSAEAVAKVQKEGIKPATSIALADIDLGFETGDYISQEAAKILRLLHIRELRKLQDECNAAIVRVQTITANPKTDTKLGKVGR